MLLQPLLSHLACQSICLTLVHIFYLTKQSGQQSVVGLLTIHLFSISFSHTNAEHWWRRSSLIVKWTSVEQLLQLFKRMSDDRFAGQLEKWSWLHGYVITGSISSWNRHSDHMRLFRSWHPQHLLQGTQVCYFHLSVHLKSSACFSVCSSEPLKSIVHL